MGVRVGIATGQVVVGELIGEGASQESTVVGETPNLASRLQGLAGKNTVVIGPRTYALAGARFECEDLGPQSLKGITPAVQAWQVKRAVVAESHFEARHRAGLTPLVGREHEIGLLLQRWEQAKEGHGQVVLLSGEAGIGKSRIVEALRESTEIDSPIRLHYQCSAYFVNSALHPVIEHLERTARIEREDSNEVKLDKLEQLLSQGSADVEAIARLIAPLLSISSGNRYPPLEISPERQKAHTLDALVSQVEGLSRHNPVLLIFEDLHLADPTSLELLGLTIERAVSIPILMAFTFRPEFSPPWGGHSHITTLTLNRFTRVMASELVANVTGGKPLPDAVLKRIIEKTDGVPLYVEELTKTILESGWLSEGSDRYIVSGPLPEVAVPATLQDSLTARLDRLGSVKEVAQTASVIGREFDYELLQSISPLSKEKVRSALDRLTTAELVFRRSSTTEERYTFKHALVQETAYRGLLRSKREAIHERIAKLLQEQFSERVNAEPELLARHLTEAGLLEPSVEQWKRAGLKAMDSSANMEALSHLTKALELFEQLEPTRKSAHDELSLQVPLAAALVAVKGWSASETGDAYFRSRELCRQIGDTRQTIPVLYGIWSYQYMSAHLKDALELANECLRLAERGKDRTHLMAAHSAVGQTLVDMGELNDADQHLEKSFALYQSVQDQSVWQDYGEDPALTALAWSVWVSWFRGFPEKAFSQCNELVEATQKSSATITTAWALTVKAGLQQFCGEFGPALDSANNVIEFSTERDISLFRAFGSILKGHSLVALGQAEDGAELMCQGVEDWKTAGAGLCLPLFYAMLAEGYGRCKRPEQGLSTLDYGFEHVERPGDQVWLPELYRVRGTVLLSQPADNSVQAEDSFRKATDVAREQGSKSFELRATTDLARLYERQGQGEEAANILTPAYGWFTEGFGTADLKEAKLLLERLG